MALIQIQIGNVEEEQADLGKITRWYDEQADRARDLMKKKNTDYDEAWRDLRLSSITDLILAKLLRLRQIEENLGKLSVSEGREANYLDIINYALFALILLSEKGN